MQFYFDMFYYLSNSIESVCSVLALLKWVKCTHEFILHDAEGSLCAKGVTQFFRFHRPAFARDFLLPVSNYVTYISGLLHFPEFVTKGFHADGYWLPTTNTHVDVYEAKRAF